jgi:carbonic anhydrase
MRLLTVLGLAARALGFVATRLAQASGGDEQPSPRTPEESLRSLKQGNERFVNGRRVFRHLDQGQIARTAKAQAPYATILSCSDSRVPVEHLFDAGIGDLFVIRVAGNVCSDHEDGSIEYAVGHLKTPLVVVVGHTRCGAVTAVVEHAELEGKIPHLVEHIIPAFKSAQSAHTGCDRDGLIDVTARCNVHKAIADLLDASPDIRSRVASGAVKVVGAIYDLQTGRVEWLEPADVGCRWWRGVTGEGPPALWGSVWPRDRAVRGGKPPSCGRVRPCYE